MIALHVSTDATLSGIMTFTLSLIVALLATFMSCLIYDYHRRVSSYQRQKQNADSPSGRLLGSMEAFFELSQRLKSCIDVNVAFFRSVGEPIDETLLRKALLRVARRHPALRMTIKGGMKAMQIRDNKHTFLRFEENPNFCLDVKTIATDDWSSVMHSEYNASFDSERGPLWRVKILNPKPCDDEGFDKEQGAAVEKCDDRPVFKNVFIFAFHHGIVDGLSIMKFYKNLRDELSNCAGDAVLPKVTSLPLLPSLLDAVPAKLSQIALWRKILLYLKIKFHTLFHRNGMLPTPPAAPCAFTTLTGRMGHRRKLGAAAKLIPVRISRKHSQALLQKAKQKRCKVNAMMETVIRRAILKTIEIIRKREEIGEINEEDSERVMTRVGDTTFVNLTSIFAANAIGHTTNPAFPEAALGCFMTTHLLQHATPVFHHVDQKAEGGCKETVGKSRNNGVTMRESNTNILVDKDVDINIDDFWREVKLIGSKIANTLTSSNPLGDFMRYYEVMYQLFPAEYHRTVLSETPPVASMDHVLSNRGACTFINGKDGKIRDFELLETIYAPGPRSMTACFETYLVSVRGKFSWNIFLREDNITTAEDGQLLADCILHVLDAIV